MSHQFRPYSYAMRYKRILLLAALAVLCLFVEKAATAQTTVSSVVTNQTKPYVALGSGATQTPYLMYGVQIRIDALLGPNYPGWTAWYGTGNGDDGIDKYFAMANVAGYKTVIVPVPWRYVESNTTPGTYTFDYVQNVIASAYAHSLKVQLLWYGSDVCGISDAPDYVMNTPSTYPRLASNTVFLDLSNSNIVNAESSALQAMMNYVAHNDPNQTVVVLGIENEPDGCSPSATQPNWTSPSSLSQYMYAGGQYTAVVNLVNKLASDAKTQWSGVTRCNLGYSFRTVDFDNDRASRGTGVDMLGVDLYTNDVNSSSTSSTHNVVSQLTPSPIFATLIPYPSINTLTSLSALNYNPAPSRLTTNVAHQPEGGAQYQNYDNLVFSNFADGAGSLIYELRTLQWTDNNGHLNPTYDLGVYRATPTKGSWTDRDGSIQVPYNIQGTVMGTEGTTQAIKDFNSTIYKADQKIAVTYPGRCAAFLNGGNAGTILNATIGGTPIKYQTWDNGPAFAIKDTNGDIILLNLSSGSYFTMDPNYPASRISEGWYDSTNVWHEEYTKSYISGTTLQCWAKECIRFIHQ